MKASSTFVRLKNGRTSFAVVGVETLPVADPLAGWAAELTHHARFYDEAIQRGVSDALGWHMRSGGAPASFLVIEFIELYVDTKPDAVQCAATTAAWQALGHDAAQLRYEFIGDEWRVSYGA